MYSCESVTRSLRSGVFSLVASCALLACDASVNQQAESGLSSNIQLRIPAVLRQPQAVPVESLFAEVTITYDTDDGAVSLPPQTASSADGGETLQTRIDVPAGIPFSVQVIWYDSADGSRLDLTQLTRGVGAIAPGESLALTLDFSEMDSEAFDFDGDNFSNLTERLEDTSPFDAGDTPGSMPVPTEDTNPVVDGIEFVNVANGAVLAVADQEDSNPVAVIQTVPVLDDGVASSVDTPITLFFNDKLLLESLFSNIVIRQNGVQVTGTATITESSAGSAIITFVPSDRYEAGATVTLTLNGGAEGVVDDGGNPLVGNSGENFEISLTTIDENVQAFDGNLSFETSTDGVVFTGDGAVVSDSLGCLVATDGTSFAAITTGSNVVSGGVASGETSSTVQLGPINLNGGQGVISFDYNFVSAEFNEFVGSEFDDSAVISVTGPGGNVTNVLTTVNMVGEEGNTECSTINGVGGTDDGGGDAYAGQTGWINETVNVSELGSPVFITFTVTDVSDSNLTSVLAIDNIRF